MKKEIIIKWIFAFGLIMMSSVTLFASKPDSIYRKVPSLGDHTYIPLDKNFNPFITSQFKIMVGTAQTESFDVAQIQFNGKDIYTLDGNIFFSSVIIDYQQRVKDWLAVYFRYSLAARFGTEFSSLYAEGLNTLSGKEIGWLIKLVDHRKHILSANLEISDQRANFLNIERILLNLVEDTIITVSENIPALFGSIGLRYAYAPNDLFGFTVSGEVAYGESFNREETGLYFQGGITAEINLYERTGIPVGIAIKNLSTNIPSFNQMSKKPVNISGLKVAYTGGSDFVIGFDASWSRLPSKSNDYLDTLLVLLQFNFFF